VQLIAGVGYGANRSGNYTVLRDLWLRRQFL